MRKILIIENGKPTLLNESDFTEESKLKDYIEEYPTVIPLSEIKEGASDLLCIGSEVIAGPGFIDLLFIDKDGLLTLVETKLSRNSEARRAVIGQIIEYASYVSQWTVDDVYRIANDYFKNSKKVPVEYRGDSLNTVLERVVGNGFLEGDFRFQVEQNLKDGRIRLIIGVDRLVEPLRATVTFLNSFSTFEILLLEVSSFEESASKKALIPLLFGYKSPPHLGIRVPTTEENFLENIRTRFKDQQDVIKGLEDIYKFSKDNASAIVWGTGGARRSFIFRGVNKGSSIFTLYSDGEICNNFRWYQGANDLESEKLKEFWANELSQNLGINFPKDRWSIAKVDDLVQRNKLEGFKKVVLAVCQRIEGYNKDK